MTLDAKALDALLEVIGGDMASMVELIESFEEEGPRLMRQMTEVRAASNLEILKRAAHTMKSSARDFGAAELSRLCGMMEQQCLACEPAGIPELLSAIESEFTRAMDELAAFKATCKNN